MEKVMELVIDNYNSQIALLKDHIQTLKDSVEREREITKQLQDYVMGMTATASLNNTINSQQQEIGYIGNENNEY